MIECCVPQIGECTCDCHRFPGVFHLVACCEKPPFRDPYRADGDAVCTDCGQTYRSHPVVTFAWAGAAEDESLLRRLCNGDLVKL